MIRAGEQGGFLEVVLSQIADFRTAKPISRARLGRPRYPIMLACMAIMVLVGMLTWLFQNSPTSLSNSQ